jgi:hypothetical protein
MTKRRFVIDPRGNRIEVEEVVIPPIGNGKQKQRRKPFKANWVKYPTAWSEKLRGSSGAAHDLANALLAEAFKRAYVGGEVKLSAVSMPRRTRAKTAKGLVKLRLIKLHRDGNGQTHRVTLVLPNGFSFRGDK